jgi:holo-[acyl-carrier protein] synthase
VQRDRRPTAELRPPQVDTALARAADKPEVPRLVGIGVDVVDLVEFEHNTRVGGSRWLRKLFTASELAYSEGRADRLGARFAAKEAVVKALGTGFRAGIAARRVEIVTNTDGQSHVVLHEQAIAEAAARGVGEILISMTREGDCAAAVAWAVMSDNRSRER